MPPVKKPTVYKQAGSIYYWIAYYDENDIRVRCSSKSTEERAAWRLLEDRLKAVQVARSTPKVEALPVEAGFDLFMDTRRLKAKSRSRYDSTYLHFLNFFELKGITDIRQIDRRAVSQFVDWRKITGIIRRRGRGEKAQNIRVDISEATIHRDLAFLSSVWGFLEDHVEWSDHMPINPVKKEQKKLAISDKRVRFAVPQEWKAIMGATRGVIHKKILTIAVETGMREHEICTLSWNDVDLDRRQIVLTPQSLNGKEKRLKNNKARTIPLTHAAHLALCDIVRHDKMPYVFCHMVQEKPQPFLRMAGWWKGTRARSGVQNFRFHDIRHTFASNYLNNGGTLYVLKDLLGHSSVEVTERYGHLVTTTVHAEVKMIDERVRSAVRIA